MNRLIKNELTKIFHKKAIYIILVVILGFIILFNVLSKILSNIDYTNRYIEEDLQFYREELKKLDKNKPEERDLYAAYKTNLDLGELRKKYKQDSWQIAILEQKGYELISSMNYAEGTERYEEAKAEYDKLIKRLENDDWKAFVKEEIEEVDSQIKELEKNKNEATKEIDKLSAEIMLQEQKNLKQALEWRLEYDISYSINNRNSFIEMWKSEADSLDRFNQQEKKESLKYDEKYGKEKTVANARILEYAIKNVKDDKTEVRYTSEEGVYLSNRTEYSFLSSWEEYTLFIIIAITIVAGTIVSEEFSKGTIKLLLVRPFKRTKIIIAKFIASFVVVILVLVFVGLAQFLVGGIINGFNSYNPQIAIYNYGKGTVEQIGLLKYSLILVLSKMPMYILMMTLSFSLGIIFNNTPIAIALPIGGIVASEIINGIYMEYEKAKFLKYFVTPNWDLGIYLFGKMPNHEGLTIGFSIIICIIYFAIMTITSLAIFNKKDIKNI